MAARLLIQLAIVYAVLGAPGLALADMAMLIAVRDNTLYSEPPPEGPLSNGAGAYLFAGATGPANPGDIRRAVLAFDLSAIPAGSLVQNATLTLSVSRIPQGGPATAMFSLHRATSDWGEGTSDAGVPGGTGAPATPGDATWEDAFFPGVPWNTPGGDFDSVPSTTTIIGDIGFYNFNSVAMVADVQSWVNDPFQNFGWFVLGDEAGSHNARRFDSRDQGGNPDGWPTLLVEFSPVPEPNVLGWSLLWLLLRRRKR